MCIGTNRTNTIDYRDPFIGSLLKEDRDFDVPVYGTMVKPIHVLNLTQSITETRDLHLNTIIIAIDSALTTDDKIGQIFIKSKRMLPGNGVGKKMK
nr:DUF1256 domain-containing protein [Clostridium gasigenes]